MLPQLPLVWSHPPFAYYLQDFGAAARTLQHFRPTFPTRHWLPMYFRTIYLCITYQTTVLLHVYYVYTDTYILPYDVYYLHSLY